MLRIRPFAARLSLALLAAAFPAALLVALPAAADGQPDETYRFAVIGHGYADTGESHLQRAIEATADKMVAFVVVTGIKGGQEACTDKVYQKRFQLIADAPRATIMLPAGSDWTECKNTAGRSNAIERLNRLRELFYGEPNSLGMNKVALTRQSMSPRWRSYAENSHWSVGKVLYATVNVPADNNHYLNEAGRNSEYEDRLVANRFWLHRLFTIARRDKLAAVVLFTEGDLRALAQPTGLRALLREALPDNDGFAETRREVLALAQKFPGKVLLVDSARPAKGAKPGIEWRGNVGHMSAGGQALEVEMDAGTKTLFKVEKAGK
jgi:hypothetical protein